MNDYLFAAAMVLLGLLSYRWALYAEQLGCGGKGKESAYVRELRLLLRISKNKRVKALLKKAIKEAK